MSITVLLQRKLCVSYTKVIYTLNLSLDIDCERTSNIVIDEGMIDGKMY